MINIPQDFNNNPFEDKKFKELIYFFSKLEKDLQYPNCKGYDDAKRILSKAQNDLILWGII